jgi:hypothetical protein
VKLSNMSYNTCNLSCNGRVILRKKYINKYSNRPYKDRVILFTNVCIAKCVFDKYILHCCRRKTHVYQGNKNVVSLMLKLSLFQVLFDDADFKASSGVNVMPTILGYFCQDDTNRYQ